MSPKAGNTFWVFFGPGPVMAERIIGTTKVTAGWKIALLKDVKELLDRGSREKLKVGDTIVYFSNEKGDIVLRRA